MKRPSFQFYPEDWLANANLRRCTHEEKGIWIDVMCLLHDQAEYGVVRWPLKELAGAVGTTVRKLRNLIEKGVLKGADTGESTEAFIYVPRSGRRDGDPVTLIDEQKGPLWFSSRMVTDEYKRQVRGGELPSPKGGLGEVLDAAPKPAPSTRAPAQAPRAAPPSPSPTPLTSSSLRSEEIGAPAPRKPRATRKCPDDFDVTDALRDWATENASGLDLARETDKFRDYTFKTAHTDWAGAWRNWMRRAAENARPPSRASPPQSKHAAAARAIYGAPSNPEFIDVETVVRQH